MTVTVITINLADGKVHDERSTRLNTVAGQRWLINHFHWAFANGMGVQIHNIADNPPA